MPSKPRKGEELLSYLIAFFAKVLLLNELVKQDISNADLARRISLNHRKFNEL